METQDYTNEIWKDIKGFEEWYQVSTHGRIRSLDRMVNGRYKRGKSLAKGRILDPFKNRLGYRMVSLAKNSNVTKIFAHRLVAMAFIPNPENKPHVNHIDSNPLNNLLSNLEWCTHSENMRHAAAAGRMVGPWKGKSNPSRIKGYTWKQKRKTCTVCGLESGGTMITRYHNEKCKQLNKLI